MNRILTQPPNVGDEIYYFFKYFAIAIIAGYGSFVLFWVSLNLLNVKLSEGFGGLYELLFIGAISSFIYLCVFFYLVVKNNRKYKVWFALIALLLVYPLFQLGEYVFMEVIERPSAEPQDIRIKDTCSKYTDVINCVGNYK